ncbi:MAG TPA: MFS transporter [Rhabdochlamydiaceae bacterium]
MTFFKNAGEKRYAFFPVYLTYFLDNFGLAIIYPIFTPIFLIPNYLIPAPYSFFHRTIILGLVIGVFPFAQFIGAPLLGQFSDCYGRKRAFYITILGTAIGYTLTAYSILIHSLFLVFLSRFLTGLFASNLTLCLAAIVDMSPDEPSRTRNFGHIAAIGGLSFIVAIAMGGILSDPSFGKYFNPSFPFWVTAGLAYINFLCMVLLFRETLRTTASDLQFFKGMHNIWTALRSKELRALYMGNFFFMLSWVASMQFLPTFLIKHFHFTTFSLTLALVAIGIVWSIANVAINRRLAKRVIPARTLQVCLFFLCMCLLSTIFANSLSPFLSLFYPAVCFASLCWTNSLANVSLNAPDTIQGSILGINQSMTSLAAMLAPPLGGFFAGGGKGWLFSFTGCSALLAFLIISYANHMYKKNLAQR